MPYDPTDPRAQMTPPTSTTIGLPRPAQYRELHAAPPDEQHPHGSVTWWTRSQSVVVGFTEAHSGEELAPPGDVGGEFVVLVLDGAQLQVAHESGAASVTEPSVVFVPASLACDQSSKRMRPASGSINSSLPRSMNAIVFGLS